MSTVSSPTGSPSPATDGPVSTRLDAELVRRGHARSRARATELVDAGRVTVAGVTAHRPAQRVTPDDDVRVIPDAADRWVSRAAHKLLGALDAADLLAPGEITPAGATCLDAGASTGGFTQVLLARGAARVVAADVGHGQLDPLVAGDPRVVVREGLNVRDLDPGDPDLEPAPALVVADLSFISLTLVLPALMAVAAPGADLLVMVKPQFEVGRERLARDGVVTSPALRSEAVTTVARAALARGAGVRAVLPSGLPGETGNREYFLWLRLPTSPAPGAPTGGPPDAVSRGVVEAVTTAVNEDRPVLVRPAPGGHP